MKKQVLLLAAIFTIIFAAITPAVYSKAPKGLVMKLESTIDPVVGMYANLDYGVRVVVNDKRDDLCVYKIFKGFGKIVDDTNVLINPDVKTSVYNDITSQMQAMGFKLNADSATDHTLTINVVNVKITDFPILNRYVAEVEMEVMLQNAAQQYVYPKVKIADTYSLDIKKATAPQVTAVLVKAYDKTLDMINWNAIATFLKRADRPAQERNKQVTGSGDTALESTIIRWYIVSSPAGADVQWRVVSSTPDVKNTNQSFLGSTPYESTESFDVMGLTYGNSGNVQIEVSCEKAGYITQRKRFNVRQSIDQKEISTKFNLVKDE